MLSLEELCALPQAGRALLVMHRQLAMKPEIRATVFDLLAALSVMYKVLADAELTLEAIAADDEKAHAMVVLLLAYVVVERAETLAKCFGIPLTIPAEVADEFNRLRKQARREGGSS